MSSRKETKMLVEAFRLFLKEAPKDPAQGSLDFEPKASSAGVVRICDFDGTVAMRPNVPSALNAFYQALLNKRGQKLMNEKYPLQRNSRVPFNPSTDFIVSSFRSIGSAAADIGTYVDGLLAKDPPDRLMQGVINALTGETPQTKDEVARIGAKILYRGAKTAGGAVDDAPDSKSQIISDFLKVDPSHVKIVSNKTGDNKESAMKAIVAGIPKGTKLQVYDNNEKDLKQVGIAAVQDLGKDYVELFLVDERGMIHHYEPASLAKK